MRCKRPVAMSVKFLLYRARLGWLVICLQYYHVENPRRQLVTTHMSRGEDYP